MLGGTMTLLKLINKQQNADYLTVGVNYLDYIMRDAVKVMVEILTLWGFDFTGTKQP